MRSPALSLSGIRKLPEVQIIPLAIAEVQRSTLAFARLDGRCLPGIQRFRIATAINDEEVFDSSSGFTLPNGAMRSPDVAWIRLARWNALSPTQQASFAPICPDFVVELRSASDALKTLQEKMEEYIANGVLLGLLIDRKNCTVHVYHPGQSPKILTNPDSVC